MASKDVLFGNESRTKMITGMNIVADAVKVTLGPKGRNVIYDKPAMGPIITKDGVTVAKEIFLEDNFENMGAQLIKEVASKANDTAGDGTTTATVIAQAIVNEGIKAVTSGRNPMDLKRGIDKATRVAVKKLQDISVECNTTEAIAQVGSISANSDSEIGSLIAEAMETVGIDGVITVEEGKSFNNELVVVEGVQFDCGYLSPHFLSNSTTGKIELEKPLILFIDRKINSVREILPALDIVAKLKRPLVVIAESVEGEALAGLVVNQMRGVLSVVAVKAPDFGEQKRNLLGDMAIVTGGKVMSQELGNSFDDIKESYFGQAKRVVVSKDQTTIVDGLGNSKDILAKIEALRSELGHSTAYGAEKIQERVAKLAGGVAVVRVGATSDIEMLEKKARVEDALHATKAAVQEGIVPGGGSALVAISQSPEMLALLDETENDDQKQGIRIAITAMKAPLRQIVENAGESADVVLSAVLNLDENMGYDAGNSKYVNMIDAGIIDPTKVTRSSLQYASSVAGMSLTTECMIADSKDAKKVPPMPPMGHPMM